MKTPFGTEVQFDPGHCVRRGPSSPAKGAQLFSAHVYNGHGRPSQLLLSSCLILQYLVKRPSCCRGTAWRAISVEILSAAGRKEYLL